MHEWWPRKPTSIHRRQVRAAGPDRVDERGQQRSRVGHVRDHAVAAGRVEVAAEQVGGLLAGARHERDLFADALGFGGQPGLGLLKHPRVWVEHGDVVTGSADPRSWPGGR
ncbi:hypothetical protein GCM10010517_15600 [Streptosporangium fragile]|uniref:Uncharacterized protein n=1 Tax=Streptosporangium fragile TaxID=46186 RepID=A0ABN3VVM4_9ACTN